MDRERYEDYLVDKAKELLQESAADVENNVKRARRRADQEVATADDGDNVKQNVEKMRKEVDALAHGHEAMDNDELEAFLRGDSSFHRDLDDVERPDFSDWENRLLITNPDTSVEELAAELDRSVAAVQLQLRVLGLDRRLEKSD